MAGVLHRDLRRPPAEIVEARGLRVTTSDGRRFLDAVSGGAAVASLGHGHPAVHAAIAAQLDRVAYFHTSFFTSGPAERLAEDLLRDAPAGLAEVAYCSGGSEAMETALKLARQYWVEAGEPQRTRVISRRQSYHGATLGALAIGGNVARREVYAPLLFDASFVDPCYAYRERRQGESDIDYGRRAAHALEVAIQAAGPSTVAAFVMEPVVGATLGCAPAVPGYLREIRRICDRHGVLLILDEVMCGLGRTGSRYACADDEVSPDLMTLAKGLGGGFQPIGAVLVHERITRALRDGSGTLKHGLTYMGHPTACAASLAVQRVIRDDDLVANVARQGDRLRRGLRDAFDAHPHVGDVRGRGLFVGIELVADRATKRPFPAALALHARVKRAAMDRGLLVYPGGGCIDGRLGDHVLLAPAFVVTDAETDEIVERLAATFADLGDVMSDAAESTAVA